MVESQLRALYEQIASSEPPPSQVNTRLALSLGRVRLRRRRVSLAATPALAAVAVAAVALATGAVPGLPKGTGASPAAHGPARAPSHFDPLVPYAAFGWLPAGQSSGDGGTGRTEMYLTAGPKPGNAQWALTVYSSGRCKLATTPRDLNCVIDSDSGQTLPIVSEAPTVNGHRAFWSGASLVWQYARDGWALLGFPAPHGHPAQHEAVKVAEHIRYGAAAARPILFPAQLTGVPSRWQVGSVTFAPSAGVLRASQYSLTRGPVALNANGGESSANMPFFTTDPTTAHSSCYFYGHGESVRKVIDGYHVTVNHLGQGRSAEQQLCAADADGLDVFLSEIGRHFTFSAVKLFADHFRLLGTNPANWTTKPIG